MQSVLIKASGDVQVIERDRSDYKIIGRLVANGEAFDVVSFEEFSIYVDDCGLINGSPTNNFASYISNRIIAGDVLLSGPCDEEGYDTDCDSIFTSEEFAKHIVFMNGEKDEDLENIREGLDLTPKFMPMTDEEFDNWLAKR
jgi:hypothetical protein